MDSFDGINFTINFSTAIYVTVEAFPISISPDTRMHSPVINRNIHHSIFTKDQTSVDRESLANSGMTS